MQKVFVPRDGQLATFPDYHSAHAQLPQAPVCWVDLVDPAPKELAGLAELGLTDQVLADALDWENRPAVRELPEVTAVTFRIFQCQPGEVGLDVRPLQVLIVPPVVVTVRPCPDRWIAQLQDEVARHPRLLSSVGHLVYLVLDAVVDGHFPALDDLEDRLDALDEEILERASTSALPRINEIKRMLLAIRRAIIPERDATNFLLLDRPDYLSERDLDDLRDLQYRTLQVIELADTYRDLLGNSLDAYMANVSNRLNEVMKVLTMVATVMLPLTLVVGFYGTNFARTWPPYEAPWGAAAIFLGMAATAGLMLWWFRRKGWM